MGRKGKRTKGIEEAHPFAGTPALHPQRCASVRHVNPDAAGVDIGAVEIVVCVAGENNMQIVKAFGNYTVDLQAIGNWLKEHNVKTVAMESTGVYWIPLFEVLESMGLAQPPVGKCLLISSRSLRRVPGRKSDIEDAQWIQTLHSYGLLESSFRPQADLVALRTMLRHRAQLLEHRAPHIQHTLAPPARAGVQKALLQMNVQLSQALSDVMGETGQAIIRAIVAGERSPQLLAAFREPNCKKSEEEIGKALTGTWREEHLFVLKQSLELYDFYTEQIKVCDEEIDLMYTMIRPDWETGELPPIPKKKQKTHSKNAPKNAEEIRKHLKRINGVDISLVEGFGVSLTQTVTMEVGSNVSEKFPTEKNFCSWLGVAPKHEISGGKVLKNKTLKTKNRAGQAFPRSMAAQSVKKSDGVFGVMYKRFRARQGPAQATVSIAHALARVVYRMLKYQVEFETINVNEYEKKYEEQQVKYLKKKVAKLGFQLVPVVPA